MARNDDTEFDVAASTTNFPSVWGTDPNKDSGAVSSGVVGDELQVVGASCG